MGRQAASNVATLVGNMRANAAAIAGRIAELKRTHPERMAAQDWRELRIDMLADLDLLRQQILITADLLEQQGVHRERDHS